MATQTLSATLVRRGLGQIVQNGFEDIVTLHTEFLNVDTGDGQYIERAFHSELGPAQRIGATGSQGLRDELPRGTLEVSPVVRKYYSRYGLAFDFVVDEADDDLYGVIRRGGGSLGKSLRYAMEVSAHDLLNNGEDGTNYPQGWEATALFKTGQGLLNSTTTVDNLLTASGPSFAALANIYAYGDAFVDDQGMPTPIMPVLILTGMRNSYLWQQILKSPTQIGQNNPSVINPYKPITVLGSQYLSNPFDTYVFYAGYRNHMHMTMRRAATFRTWDEHDPERVVAGVDARYVVYTTNNLRVVKIPGAK